MRIVLVSGGATSGKARRPPTKRGTVGLWPEETVVRKAQAQCAKTRKRDDTPKTRKPQNAGGAQTPNFGGLGRYTPKVREGLPSLSVRQPRVSVRAVTGVQLRAVTHRRVTRTRKKESKVDLKRQIAVGTSTINRIVDGQYEVADGAYGVGRRKRARSEDSDQREKRRRAKDPG